MKTKYAGHVIHIICTVNDEIIAIDEFSTFEGEPMDNVTRTIANLKDKAVRKMLIDAGWTPPVEVSK